MKHTRAFLILLFFCALFPARTPPVQAKAEAERYAVAESADVWFYGSETEESKLFCLPRTYYVKVLSKGKKFTAAEYLTDRAPFQKLTGYCLTQSLTFVDFVPERPYLYREVTVEYLLPGTSLGNGSFAGRQERFVYYGSRYEGGKLYFYVGKDGVFDYIPAEQEISYELNTDYLAAAEDTGGNAGGLSPAEITVIVLSAFAVLVIGVLILRGRKAVPEHEEF